MIDEKKLIEILSKNSIFEKITNAEDKNIFDIINDLPKEDKWIPCEERFPENNTNVIVCFSYGTVTELTYLGNGIFQGIYEYSKKVIIAWQPLPEPYKESETL